MLCYETNDKKCLFHVHVKQWSETEHNMLINMTQTIHTYIHWLKSDMYVAKDDSIPIYLLSKWNIELDSSMQQ